jgi:hypothetical protein
MRESLNCFAFFLFLFLSSFPGFSQDFNKDHWLEDFSQLKKELALNYANLDWAIQTRGLDLKQLSMQTEARLMQARTDGEARKVLDAFLNSFGDGHLYADWNAKKVDPQSPFDKGKVKDTLPLCQQLNFQSQNQSPRINFSLLKGFKEINTEDNKYFPIGILTQSPNKKVGVIRISIFSQYAFPDLCELASTELKLVREGKCDEACEERIEIKTANLLTAALTRQIEVLKKGGINELLVDITGNGGGTNWIEPAARILSAKPLQTPRQLFISHPHWTNQLMKRLELIRQDATKGSGKDNEAYLHAVKRLEAAVTASKSPCDRNGVWENEKPACAFIAPVQLYPQSVLAYARPGSLPSLPSAQYLFYPSRYAYMEGVYKGPLTVLVDANTWSSAEYFAAMLKDNKAARIIGEPTGGAGCGYTNGGIPTYLKNSGARIKIPDCIRLRADGSNEVSGITPDVLIPWRRNDSPYQKAQRVSDAISGK